jgi:trigger factor
MKKFVDAVLPENFPEKELVNKAAKFKCKILNVKNPEEVKIDDNFAKNLGAKDLNDLKTLISKQINDEYKNSLDQLSKNQILKEIDKIKVDEIPENLIEEEVKILSQGMDEAEAKKNKAKFTETAKTRIKTGLILNEFGEQNKIQVSEQEIQAEVQKQLRMMPGQEKMVMDFYQKNPSAVASLRGTVYEEKILNLIKEKAKPNKKEISKDEAEKILKEAHKHDHNHDHDHDKGDKKKDTKKKVETKSKEKKKSSSKASKSSLKQKKLAKSNLKLYKLIRINL